MGNFRGRKLSRIGRKGAFRGENLLNIKLISIPIILWKNFAGGYKIVKFVVFSLESYTVCTAVT